ncbi:hypothetical protein MMC13_008097 [Lambiella insularis]|nr:hypothetical protein [Lambiella insularis]
MLVPRAFHYATSLSTRSTTDIEKRGMTETRRSKKDGTKGFPVSNAVKTKPSPPAPASRPVVIPTRSQSPRSQTRRNSTIRVRQEEEHRRASDSEDALSPSMAVLIAVTAIPETKSIAARRTKSGHSKRVSDLRSLVGSPEKSRTPSSSSSPQSWEVLQSPPQDPDADNWSIGSDSTIAPQSSFHSLSTDSMPSLDLDLESPRSSSQLSTPGKHHGRRERRGKSLSESFIENCVLDHPLSPLQSKPESFTDSRTLANEAEIVLPDISIPITPSRFSFKSNLTASFRVLKSAAQSFSNMAVQRDEFLTRSILSIAPQYTDERRPVLSDEIPDPALRRYLNPITASPAELYFHHGQNRGALQERCTASIQLQTYRRAVTPSKHATSPPIFMPSSKDSSESGLVVEAYSSSRQREPRENSDFLRVIVLEMNMRKAGKLQEAATGRARIWLPARPLVKQRDEGAKGVPRRWTGIVD